MTGRRSTDMSIFNHNIYENVRTRAIVLHQGCVLMIPPSSAGDGAVAEQDPFA
jgi:hypothetical protein